METTNFKWLYNGKVYNSQKEMKEILKWSSCKWRAKLAENKIIKITQTEDSTYEKLHTSSK